MDYWKGKIPNWLVVMGMLHGLFLRRDYIPMIVQLVCLLFLFYPLFQTGKLGAGDVKLFLLLGVFLSTRDLVLVLMNTFFVAAGFSILKVAVNHTKIAETKIHLAVFVLIGDLMNGGGFY